MLNRRQFLAAPLLLSIPALAAPCTGPVAPVLIGGPWLNSPPLDWAQLQGRVVLLEFWTYGCYNCRNVEPYVKAWDQRYRPQGLTVVGVHTPEFSHEKSRDRVEAYLRQQAIGYPVMLDNEMATWNAWGNRYWPAMYLVNRHGRVCYAHFGEGRYATTEARIRELLAAS
jgi:thiol-disulfide isomerase/thioredoxin